MRLFLVLVFLVFFVVTGNVFASLDSGESVKVKILRKQTETVITINRGIEDGVEKHDHVKFTNDSGFIARAIAIKSEMKISHWKLYRILHAEALGESGSELKMLALSKDSIPDEALGLIDGIELVNTPETIAKQRAERAQKLSPQTADQAIQALSVEELEQDLNDLKIDLAVKQFQVARKDNAQDIIYGIGISNIERKKYASDLGFDYKTKSRMVATPEATNLSKEKRIKSEQYDGWFEFKVNEVYKNFSYFARLEYNRQGIDDYYPVERRLGLGVTGVQYDFVKNSKKVKELSASYIPMFYKSVENSAPVMNYATGLSESKETTTSYARHTFKFGIETYPASGFSFSEHVRWAPYHGPPSGSFKTSNCQFENILGLNYSMGTHVVIGYGNIYSWDRDRRGKQNLPSTDMIHTLTLLVTFNI